MSRHYKHRMSGATTNGTELTALCSGNSINSLVLVWHGEPVQDEVQLVELYLRHRTSVQTLPRMVGQWQRGQQPSTLTPSVTGVYGTVLSGDAVLQGDSFEHFAKYKLVSGSKTSSTVQTTLTCAAPAHHNLWRFHGTHWYSKTPALLVWLSLAVLLFSMLAAFCCVYCRRCLLCCKHWRQICRDRAAYRRIQRAEEDDQLEDDEFVVRTNTALGNRRQSVIERARFWPKSYVKSAVESAQNVQLNKKKEEAAERALDDVTF